MELWGEFWLISFLPKETKSYWKGGWQLIWSFGVGRGEEPKLMITPDSRQRTVFSIPSCLVPTPNT